MDNSTFLEQLGVTDPERQQACLEAMEKYADNKWWEPDTDPRKYAYYQINEPILLGEFTHFHESIELLLMRLSDKSVSQSLWTSLRNGQSKTTNKSSRSTCQRMSNNMDIKYTRRKFHEAATLAKQAATLPPEERTFRVFTGAMDALYACIEWLPFELQSDARKAYDKLNEAIEESNG